MWLCGHEGPDVNVVCDIFDEGCPFRRGLIEYSFDSSATRTDHPGSVMELLIINILFLFFQSTWL